MGKKMNLGQALRKMGTALAAIWGLSLPSPSNAAPPKQPNIVFMVADNLGRESVGYYGSHLFKTPRMDKLAGEGVIFENCLIATPLCAPARCAWNTGRHPFRVGINSQPAPGDPESGLSLDEITIAEVLKGVGYDTALFGKWNLGYAEKFNPVHQGYDEYYGSNAGHGDYYTHLYDVDKKSHFYHNLTPINDQGYFDKLFTDEAIKYLQARKANPRPFYLNLAFYAPHGPYQTPPGYDPSDDRMKNYQYMIEYLDLCVGRVVDEVQRLGLAENTLIVFFSDQGGSAKNDFGRTLSEGSLKVVCNACWPGHVPRGRRIATPWMHLDLFAVFAAAAGAKVPQDRTIDAVNVWPLFEGKEMEHDRTLYWTFQSEDAIRRGDVKLRMQKGKVLGLYNLADDPEEKKDLSAGQPAKVKEMAEMQAKWKNECEAHQTSTVKSKKEKNKDKSGATEEKKSKKQKNKNKGSAQDQEGE
jgi:arylsulfatase A